MFDPPVPSSPFSSACKTDCNSRKGEKKGEYSKEEEHFFCIKKTEKKTLTICWDGMFVTIPYEHQQTKREVTSVATGVYKNEFNIDSSEKWGAKSKLSASTRSFDELSPEMLVRDVVEQSGIRMLYLIQGAGEGNKVEGNNCNSNSSNSFTHDSVILPLPWNPRRFPVLQLVCLTSLQAQEWQMTGTIIQRLLLVRTATPPRRKLWLRVAY